MLRFLSYATLSQLAIIASQLVLLPLQIHSWGHDIVALWLSTLALTGILNVSDLGLRNAGFAALAANAPPERFSTLWTIMRGHMALATLAVLAVVAAWLAPRAGAEGSLFLFVLALAATAEVFLGLRVTFMEAKGLIAPAEALFFAMAGSRVVIAAALIGFFNAGPLLISLVWLLSAVGAVCAQSLFRFVRETSPAFGNWKLVDVATAYRDAAWSAATPLVQWAQVQAPVIALSVFAAPALVSSFVAIRALFGTMRSILQHVSRLASIKFGDWAREKGEGRANALLLLVGAFAAWIALGFGLALFAESFTITGKLFDLPRDNNVRIIAFAVTFSTILSVHSLFTLSLARFGRFALTGIANYAYFGVIALTCLLAATLGSMPVLLGGLVFADAGLLLLVVGVTMRREKEPAQQRARMTFFLAVASCLAVATVCWRLFMSLEVHENYWRLAAAEAMACAIWLLVGGLLWLRAGSALRGLLAPAAAVP